MSLTTTEKIELVSARYDPDDIVDALELTTEQVLEAFPEVLEDKWDKFTDIEDELGRY